MAIPLDYSSSGKKIFLSWHKGSILLLRKLKMFTQDANLLDNASSMVIA